MNFIFFFPDEMSAGTLSSYGNPHCRTPHLDKLASEQLEHHRRELENKLLDWYLHTSDTVPLEEDVRNFKNHNMEIFRK